MKTPPVDRETEALARFQEDERVLEAAVEAARGEAEVLLASARTEADAIRRAGEERARLDCEELRARAAKETDSLVAEIRSSTARELALVERGSRENEPATLAWLLSVIAGAEPDEVVP